MQASGELTVDQVPEFAIERTRDKAHGDFACNIAMKLAKIARAKPRDLAEKVVATLPKSSVVEKVEIAGPGFINFYLKADAQNIVVTNVLLKGNEYGKSQLGEGKKVQIEFVSANPTGPLHVGHGRGAAYGAVVANLLKAVGYDVQKEYYVNDAGRQMDILATSVWLRYLELCGESIVFPVNGYKGDYVRDIAKQVYESHDDAYRFPFDEVADGLPADESTDGGDKEAHIDGLIGRAKVLLGHSGYNTVFGVGLNDIVTDIRDDLAEFGVIFD